MAGMSLFLSACAGAHFHNPNNAQLANLAASGFHDMVQEIDTELNKETRNQAAVLKAELESVRTFAQNDRDAALAIVITSDDTLSQVWYERMFQKRLEVIGIKRDKDGFAGPVQRAATILQELPNLRLAVDQKITSMRSFSYAGQLMCTATEGIAPLDEALLQKAVEEQLASSPGPIEDPQSDREAIASLLRMTHADLLQDCEQWRQKRREQEQVFATTGEAATTLAELTDARSRKAEAEARAQEVHNAFKAAEAALKAKMPHNAQKPSELITAEIQKVRSLLSGVADLAGLLGEASAIDEKLKSIDSLLASIAAGEGEKPPELEATQQRIALALAGLPNLADSFSELGRILDTPPLTALIMVKQELEARKRATIAARVREEAEMALIEEQYDALLDEISDYNTVFRLIKTARRYAEQARFKGDPFQQTLASLTFMKAPMNGSPLAFGKMLQAVKAAVVHQIHAETKGLRRRYEAAYRRIALDYEANLALTQARIDEWHAMLGPLITQQKLYHESGVKSEQLASLAVELLKAFALFGIAVGVN
jgi:hypothetical protein